jgi:hypothetical protein
MSVDRGSVSNPGVELRDLIRRESQKISRKVDQVALGEVSDAGDGKTVGVLLDGFAAGELSATWSCSYTAIVGQRVTVLMLKGGQSFYVVGVIDEVFTSAGLDHGGLSGLADDDHLQYYDLARLNAWHDDAAPQVQNWIPTYTNLTVGNGIVVARYQQGEVVWFYFSLDFGSTSVMGTAPQISLPVTAGLPSNDLGAGNLIGTVRIRDSGTSSFMGSVSADTQTTMVPRFMTVASSQVRLSTITVSAPMTWTTDDRLIIIGSYEAA